MPESSLRDPGGAALPVDAAFARARFEHGKGHLAEAERLCRVVLAGQPDHVHALQLLGVIHAGRGAHGEACRLFRAALRIDPRSAETCSNLGSALSGLGRFDEALACYDDALTITPDRPEVYYNRGLALKALNRFSAALASHDRAIALRPEYPEAWNQRGSVLRALGRLGESLASFEHALAQRPGYEEALHDQRLGQLLLAEAHWNENQCRQMICESGRGWDRDEWRRRERAFASRVPILPMLLWLGDDDIAGKSIVLHAGEGLGNTIQFCRYVDAVTAMGADVVLRVQPPLKSLLARMAGVKQVVSFDDPLPHLDFHCPLLNLPLVLETHRDTIPARIPYLEAAPDKLRQWRKTLGTKTKPRIGLAWSGGTFHKNDHRRSIGVQRLVALMSGDFDFISLHKDVRPDDLAVLSATPGFRDFGDQQHDFSDAAALTSLTDLVISVDTSLAHLAGALGKPVWLLLSFIHDWRWMLEPGDTPWYPTARLFRQTAPDDWGGVVASVGRSLSHWCRSAVALDV